jgi:hypothetical protein
LAYATLTLARYEEEIDADSLCSRGERTLYSRFWRH